MQPEHEHINGEHGAILREIHLLCLNVEVIKTKQETVIETIKKLDNLPCEAHIEKFRQYDNTRKVLIGTICTIVIACVSFAVAWGALSERVDNIANRCMCLEDK